MVDGAIIGPRRVVQRPEDITPGRAGPGPAGEARCQDERLAVRGGSGGDSSRGLSFNRRAGRSCSRSMSIPNSKGH